MTTKAPGPIVRELLRTGWSESVITGEACGAVGERTGYCERPGKWTRGSTGPVCAAHARACNQWDGRR